MMATHGFSIEKQPILGEDETIIRVLFKYEI